MSTATAKHRIARHTATGLKLGSAATALAMGLLYANPAHAACDVNAPTSGTTVTCDTTAPNPDTVGVQRIAAARASNVTVNVNTGSRIVVASGEAIVLGSGATINVAGTVQTTDVDGANAIDLAGGPLTISVATGGQIRGTDFGIFLADGAAATGTITNSGTISGGAAALVVTNGTSVVGNLLTINNQAGGSLTTMAFGSAARDVAISNAGQITSGDSNPASIAIDATGMTGALRLTMLPGGTIQGLVSANTANLSGANVLMFSGAGSASGTFDWGLINNGGAALAGEQYFGFTSFGQSGGNWTFTGGTGTGPIVGFSVTESGTSLFNGTMGNVYVETLVGINGNIPVIAGTGTIGRLRVRNSRTVVAPGSLPGVGAGSIGTLTVGGFDMTGTLEIDTNDLGLSDKLIVSGAVSIVPANSILNIRSVGTYAGSNPFVYTIIDNDGTDAVDGTFGTVTNNLAFLTPTVNYAGGSGNDVVLTLTPGAVTLNCTPAAASNVTAVCTGITTGQNGSNGYGTGLETGVNLTVNTGANVSGSLNAIVLGTGSSVTTQTGSTVTTAANGGTALFLGGSGGTTSISGTVSATGTNGHGITIAASGHTLTINSGALVSVVDGPAINAAGNTTLTVAGTVEATNGSAIVLNGTGNVVHLVPGAFIHGALFGGGSDALFFDGGAGFFAGFDIGQTTLGGFTNFTKTGGSEWTLVGTAGPSSVLTSGTLQGGTTFFDAVFPALALSVQSGATLGGGGTLGNVTIASGGFISPDEFSTIIGTLNTGNLLLASGSNFRVNTSDVDGADQLIVTGTVGLGGANLILANAGTYDSANPFTYTIIDNDAADAVSGTFGSITSNFAFLTPTVNYAGGSGNDVVLTLINNTVVPTLGCTPAAASNTAAVCTGTVLNQNGSNGYGTGAEERLDVSVRPAASVTGTNTGIALGSGGSVILDASTSSVSGGAYGISIIGPLSPLVATRPVIENSGTIRATATGGVGAYFENLATSSNSGINNHAGGTITSAAAGGIGVAVRLDPTGTIAVYNSGTISAAQGTGLQLSFGTSTVSNAAGATISGVIGIDEAGSDTGASTIFNDGTISGDGGPAIQFRGGNDTLVQRATGVINGTVFGGSGTDLLRFEAGLTSKTLDWSLINTGEAEGASQQFFGFERVAVNAGFPGLYTITGGTGTAPAIDLYLKGEVMIDGNLANVTVRNGDAISGTLISPAAVTLRGSGTVGTLSLTGSFLAPGGQFNTPTAIGTLTTGNLSLDAASILQIQTTDAGAADKLVVNGTVNLGGSNLLLINSGTYEGFNPFTYTIIDNDAADAVVGTFGNISNNFAFLTASVDYAGGTGNDVILSLVRNDEPVLGCTPAAANNVSAVCTGTVVNQNGTNGYGTGGIAPETGVTVLVSAGANVSGTDAGIALGSGATVTTEAGSVVSGFTGVQILDGGSVGIGLAAVEVAATGSIIDVSGTIHGTGSNGAGIDLINVPSIITILPGATVINDGQAYAIQIAGADAAASIIANSGTITSTSGGAIGTRGGIASADPANVLEVQNLASGTINGGIFGGGVARAIEVTNLGTITGGTGGAIDFGTSIGTLTLLPGGTITGTVKGGSGSTDRLIFGGASGQAVTFDWGLVNTGGTVLSGQQYSGFESFFKQGAGSWTFTGGNGTGNPVSFSASSGLTVVNGNMANVAFAVANGARLQGTGTLGAVSLASGATFAPGNSIGTINTGSLSFAAGSTLAIETSDAGGADTIVVTGTVDLGGATLALTNTGSYASINPFTYTIIDNDAADAVIGTFGTITNNLAFLTPSLNYTGGSGNDVVLTLLNTEYEDTPLFPTVAVTVNQAASATALDDLGQLPGSDAALAYNQILFMTVPQARQIFDTASGEVHAAMQASLADASDLFTHSILRRSALVGSDGERRSQAWLVSSADNRTVDADGNAGQLSSDHYGISGGVEFAGLPLSEDTTMALGLAVGYERGDGDVLARLSSFSSNALLFGFTSAFASGPFQLNAAFSYGRHEASTQRTIAAGQINRTAEATRDASSVGLSGQLRYAIPLGGLQLSPLVTLDLNTVSMRSASETGANALNLDLDRAQYSAAQIGGGAELAFGLGQGPLSGTLRAVYQHEVGDTLARQTATFAGSPSAFTVFGPARGDGSVGLGAGLTYRVADRVTLSASYDGSFGQDIQSHEAHAGLTISW